MKTVFPDIIKLHIMDENRNPLEGIIAHVTLFASRKNDYHYQTRLSDDNGYIEILKEDFIKEIETARNFYIMDYGSSLEDCLDRIKISVFDDSVLKSRIAHMKTYIFGYPAIADEINNLEMSKNYILPYEHTFNLNGTATQDIEIVLNRA